MYTFAKKIIVHLLPFSIASTCLFLVCVAFAHAQTPYQPLVGLPGLQNSGPMNLPQYINAVYLLTVTVGALFGVIKIAFAGVKYSLSDIVTDKASAKKDIQGVLLGLAILLIPFIVLQQIYPGLTNLDFLRGVEKMNLAPRPTSQGISASETASNQALTPNDRKELYGACVGGVKKTPGGAECCATSNYSGKFACSASVVDNNNSLGIDRTKVYTAEDFQALQIAYDGLDIQKTYPVEKSQKMIEAEKYCADGKKGAPVVINVEGGYGIICGAN